VGLDVLKASTMRRDGPPVADFDAVYADHVAFVWRCLRALGIAPAALDDAVQDVFVVVHRRLAEFRGASALRTWLYGITRHIASRHQRSLRRKGSRHDPLDIELPSPGPSPLERAADAEAGAFVTRFVAALNAKKRDVFILACLEEMSVPEVAEALSIPLNTAYTRLRAARAEFHSALARQGGSHDHD
jgi:RNA polymerase sigma-70 factor, ECF subfamily